MAIAFDNTNSVSSSANVASLETSAWTISGANVVLMAGVCSGAGTPVNPANVKWGGSAGTALTQRGSTLTFGTFFKASQWSLVGPTTGSNTLYCDWASNQDETALGGASYTGVDQTTPFGTQATATGGPSASPTTLTVNVTSASGELVSDVAMAGNGNNTLTTFVVGASQTARVDIDGFGTITAESLGMSDEAGGATVTMSWTSSNSGDSNTTWGILGIPLKPDGGAADPEGRLVGGKLLRGGLLHGGVLQ